MENELSTACLGLQQEDVAANLYFQTPFTSKEDFVFQRILQPAVNHHTIDFFVILNKIKDYNCCEKIPSQLLRNIGGSRPYFINIHKNRRQAMAFQV